MNNLKPILIDIIHLASQAIVTESEEVKSQALADIYDAIASVLPVERAAQRSAPTVVGRDGLVSPERSELCGAKWLQGCAPDAPQGFAKFLTVVEGVQLVRFHGKDEVKLVARRKGTSGNPNTLFEIMVDKAARVASVWRNSDILFEVKGVNVGYNKVEAMAVSSLKRWFKDQRKRNSRRRRALKRRQAEKNMEG